MSRYVNEEIVTLLALIVPSVVVSPPYDFPYIGAQCGVRGLVGKGATAPRPCWLAAY
jgi:hypothetical protein